MSDSSTSDIAKKNNRKRLHKTTAIYILSLSVGLLMGLAISMHKDGELNLSTNILLISAMLITVLLYGLIWVWYQSLDEFEKASFNEAGNLAFHTGFLAFPWYILNELGVFPPLDAIVLLIAMIMVSIVYYYGKKFI